jgi:8-oxo-dGTP diphosphatase
MMPKNPINDTSIGNPVGRFMVAVGAIIQRFDSDQILIVRRSQSLDWHPGAWEIPYGRIDQFEDAESGLRREINEEVGITTLTIVTILSVWHMFRGTEKSAHNELIGITYHCQSNQTSITLSGEHDAYRWVTPREALTYITISGIRKDVERYRDRAQ